MISRRSFVQLSSAGLGALYLSGTSVRAGTSDASLRNQVVAACRRLAPLGWQDLLLEASGGEFDIGSPDLAERLTKALSKIDRDHPGFGDYSVSGVRPIEPGSPDRSFLYHAFASPLVRADRAGNQLKGFPTLAEIEAVENYVYGSAAPSLEELRAAASGRRLGIVVFALQYLPANRSVHGTHAELCFSRAGIGRVGNAEPLYDGLNRYFVTNVEDDPFKFRVVPRRYAAYLAVKVEGTTGNFGPQDALPDDGSRSYWVPLHKLFSGRECLRGLDLQVDMKSGLRNDLIAKFHKWLQRSGFESEWRGEHLENYPFVVKDERIGGLSKRPDYGAGILEPAQNPLVRPAEYEGKPLTFHVDPRHVSDVSNIQSTSWMVLDAAPSQMPLYMEDSAQDYDRPAPQYVNFRHRVNADGSIDNLSDREDLLEIIGKGDYEALHFVDGAGDGWVEASCPQIDEHVDDHIPAYAMVGLPDFYPQINQRDLMQWWRTKVPEAIRSGLFAVPPLALSQTRIAANIDLPIGFSIEDDTVPAIVSHFKTGIGPQQMANGAGFHNKVGLPDGSPGLFDPGWDSSQGYFYKGPDIPPQNFLAGYGLGSPWIEDAKLCAALGAYWPGVAPDSTRVFSPDKALSGISYPWPSVAPMTDEEIGLVPTRDGKILPWDGVRGPQLVQSGLFRYAVYQDMDHVDYITMPNTMTAALTSKVSMKEYTDRILAMAAVYWALGIRDQDFAADDIRSAPAKIIAEKSKWAVLSFTKDASTAPDFADAEKATSSGLDPKETYRFHIYRAGNEEHTRNEQTPAGTVKFATRVEVLEEAIVFVSGNKVVLQRNGGPWLLDATMPT